MNWTPEELQSLVDDHPLVLFMKGSPDAPMCGFSRTIVGLLAEEDIEYGHFDILSDEDVRAALKEFSDWPTYPQLYVNGQFVGGLDIVQEMKEEGPLKEQLLELAH